jgi:hypothetical protein
MRKVALAAFLVFACRSSGSAQDERSLTNFESRLPDNPDFGVALSSPDEAPLQERILILEETIQSLTETVVSLALKKEAAEKQLAETSLSSTGENLDKLEFLKEIKSLKNKNERFASLALQTSEVLLLASKDGQITSPPIRAKVEECLRNINATLSSSDSTQKGNSAEIVIIHVDVPKSLIVLNAGTDKALKVGHPVQVYRGNQCQAEAVIIEVRESISAAVIQSYLQRDSKPRSGDLVKIKI